MVVALCRCGSGRPRAACCGPHLDGATLPTTAEACMRSRYSAYVERNIEYLVQSWHPSTRPVTIEVGEDVRWLGLNIKRTEGGGEEDDSGAVEFTARYRHGGRGTRLHETSRFVRDHGRWYYVDGDPGFRTAPSQP